MNESEYLALLKRSIKETPPRLYPPQPDIENYALEGRGICKQCGKEIFSNRRIAPACCSLACRKAVKAAKWTKWRQDQAERVKETTVRLPPGWRPDAALVRYTRQHGYSAAADSIGVTTGVLIGRMYRLGYRFSDSYRTRCDRGLHNTHHFLRGEKLDAVNKVCVRSQRKGRGNQDN
jgi:hypothetical protein